MARRRGEQVEVYVTIGSLKDGFKTTKSVHNSYKSELGQTTYNGSAGVFFGANSPKPPRATKEFASGTIGSYCSTDKISSLKSNGWTVSRQARIRGVKTALCFLGSSLNGSNESLLRFQSVTFPLS